MVLRCVNCNKSFMNEVEESQHFFSKGHLKATTKEHFDIYVTGFLPKTTEDVLRKYFAQHGAVKKVKLMSRRDQKPFAFVTFEGANIIMKNVLNTVHIMDDCKLTVSKKIYHAPNTSGKTKEETYREMFIILRSSGSIAEGMEKLHETEGIKDKDIEVRTEFKDKIQNILKPYYPECEVHIYGSTMNGFGVKNSDLDLLFLPNSHYCNIRASTESESQTIPSPLDVQEGKVSTSQLSLMDESSHLNFIHQLFRKEKLFFRPILIPAKCPIVNFISRKPRLICDLSCSNRLVVYNTELLKVYGEIDERVKPLVITLRIWAKYHGLIKGGEMSSYALTLMVIFFLQNVQSPILPTVCELLALGRSRMEADWECGISQNSEHFRRTRNTQSLDELLWGFFDYYLDFDFVGRILSLSSGKVLSFADLQKSGNPKVKDFKTSPLCIQDPFELSRNVSSVVKPKTLVTLKETMYTMVKRRQYHSKNQNGVKPMTTEKQQPSLNLLSLFQPVTSNIERLETNTRAIAWTINFGNAYQELLSKMVCGDKGRLEELWYETATRGVFDVLQEALMMYCEIVDKRTYVRQTGGVGDLELLLSIQCGVYYNTWSGRNVVAQSLSGKDNCENVLEKEREVSTSVLEKNPNHKFSEAKMWFMCDCFAYRKLNILDVLVLLTPVSTNKEFRGLSTFLKSFLPKTVCKVLDDQWMQV